MDFASLKDQVKYNCNVSDSKFWGYFSICGLLLRMRELYRSESSLEFYDDISMDQISPWIEKRDALWKEMEGSELRNLDIGRASYGPFDVDSINDRLSGSGLIYGAGFGRHMKPNFFLADLETTIEEDAYVVYIVGHEHVRDIDTVPAMVQGRDIFVRKNRIKGLIWERFYEMRSKKYAGVLDLAFSNYSITREDKPLAELDGKIEVVVNDITDMLIAHEVGEIMEDEGAEGWLEMLATFNGTKEEYILRAIKDVLADCSGNGPLAGIIKMQDEGRLGFYAAFLTGLYKAIFPDAISAFQEFIESRDWQKIEDVRLRGYEKFSAYRDEVLNAWNGPEGEIKVKKVLEQFG